MSEGSIFCLSFQAENDQMPTIQDWAIIFQTPLPSNAKVLSKCKDRAQGSPAAFSPYVGWRCRICIFLNLGEDFERPLLKMRQRIYDDAPGS